MAQNGTPLPETTVVCTVRLTNNNNSCFVKITNKKTHTFSVSNHQHSVVDHPGAAENLQRVRNTLSVELQFDKGNKNVMTTVLRISCWFSYYWSGWWWQWWWSNDETQTCMAKAFRATETGPFSASQAAISVKKANNETVFIIPFHWTNAYTSQKPKKNSNHPRNLHFPLRQLNTLTLLVFGQLHGGVDVGGHLAGAEAAVLLAAVVGVVALWLQTTWANTGSVNKGGWNLSAGSVLQRCADASAGLMTGCFFFVLFFIIWTSLLTELLYGFVGIWRQPSFARLIESVAVDELWRNKSIESNHTLVSIRSCEQRWVCWGEQLPRCFITLFRQGQQRSVFQKPLSLDVARHREGPARPTHALARHKHTVNTKNYW